jgi:hypothetical protein
MHDLSFTDLYTGHVKRVPVRGMQGLTFLGHARMVTRMIDLTFNFSSGIFSTPIPSPLNLTTEIVIDGESALEVAQKRNVKLQKVQSPEFKVPCSK